MATYRTSLSTRGTGKAPIIRPSSASSTTATPRTSMRMACRRSTRCNGSYDAFRTSTLTASPPPGLLAPPAGPVRRTGGTPRRPPSGKEKPHEFRHFDSLRRSLIRVPFRVGEGKAFSAHCLPLPHRGRRVPTPGSREADRPVAPPCSPTRERFLLEPLACSDEKASAVLRRPVAVVMPACAALSCAGLRSRCERGGSSSGLPSCWAFPHAVSAGRDGRVAVGEDAVSRDGMAPSIAETPAPGSQDHALPVPAVPWRVRSRPRPSRPRVERSPEAPAAEQGGDIGAALAPPPGAVHHRERCRPRLGRPGSGRGPARRGNQVGRDGGSGGAGPPGRVLSAVRRSDLQGGSALGAVGGA